MRVDACGYARKVSSRQDFTWKRFEALAFNAYPELQALIHPAVASKRLPSEGTPAWVAAIVLLLAQIHAFIQLIEGTGGRGPGVLPTEAVRTTGQASVMSLIALGVLAALAYRRRRSGQIVAVGVGGVVLLAGIAASINLGLLIFKGSRNDVEHWQMWAIPSVLCIVFAAILFVVDSGHQARLRVLLRRIPQTEVDLLRAHIDEGLDVLHSRKILSDTELKQAKQVKLGHLHLSMLPLEESQKESREQSN